MASLLLISVLECDTRVALLEDGRLAEFYVEGPGRQDICGNIYKGRVVNILPGVAAAFVDFGLERPGYLFVEEVAGPWEEFFDLWLKDELPDPRYGLECCKTICETLSPGAACNLLPFPFDFLCGLALIKPCDYVCNWWLDQFHLDVEEPEMERCWEMDDTDDCYDCCKEECVDTGNPIGGQCEKKCAANCQ